MTKPCGNMSGQVVMLIFPLSYTKLKIVNAADVFSQAMPTHSFMATIRHTKRFLSLAQPLSTNTTTHGIVGVSIATGIRGGIMDNFGL